MFLIIFHITPVSTLSSRNALLILLLSMPFYLEIFCIVTYCILLRGLYMMALLLTIIFYLIFNCLLVGFSFALNYIPLHSLTLPFFWSFFFLMIFFLFLSLISIC